MNFVDYSTVIRDILIDFASLYFLAYVILYRKYQNAEMFVSAALFNVFMLLIVMALVRTDFNIAVGFGLFALLSLVQLRSAQFTKTEVAYLFGSVALAVINGVGIMDLSFVLICNTVIILSTWFIGNWSLEHSANLIRVDNVRKMMLTLDHIDKALLADRERMRSSLEDMMSISIQSFEIKKVDFIRELVDVSIIYTLPDNEIPNYSDNVSLPEPASEADANSY